MKECLMPHVEFLRETLAGSMSLYEWLGDPDLDIIPENDGESASFSYGYIQGVADAANKTMIELLDSYDFDLNMT